MKRFSQMFVMIIVLVLIPVLLQSELFAQGFKPFGKHTLHKPYSRDDQTNIAYDDDEENSKETDTESLNDNNGDSDGGSQDGLTEIDNFSGSNHFAHNLHRVPNATSEVADALSAFSLGQAALLGDIAFNSSGYWAGKSNRFRSPNINAVYRGQSPCVSAKPPILYIQPYYKTVQTDACDHREGYGFTKIGFLSGLTVDTDSTTSVGVLFGYANPELYRTDRQVRMNDYHVGMMLVKSLPLNVDFGALFSMGWQDGQSNRYVTRTDAANDMVRYRFHGDLSGHTFNATANLGKRIEIGRHFMLKPMVGVDYEGMWISSFTEQINDGVRLTGTLADTLPARRSYDDSHFNRVLFKVGLAGSLAGSQGGISGKIFYGTQLGGNDYATMDATLMDGLMVGDRRYYNSLPIGRDFVSLDGSIHRFVNETKTALLFASYQTTLYSSTTVQTILLGFQWMK